MKLAHRRWLWLVLSALVLAVICIFSSPGFTQLFWYLKLNAAVSQLPDAKPLQGSDRLLVIAPHPDDEVLACGGTILQALRAGASVDVVWLTCGDSSEWGEALRHRKPKPGRAEMLRLGEQRMSEARAAGLALGLPPARMHFLGYPDSGLLHLFLEHYYIPYYSESTGVDAVPYGGTVHRGAKYTGKNLDIDLAVLCGQIRPTLVYVPALQDHHADHRAAAYFALRFFGSREELHSLRFYMVHGGKHWPLPKGVHRTMPLGVAPRAKELEWTKVELPAADVEKKLTALREHRSQMVIDGHFLKAFVRRNELFSEGFDLDYDWTRQGGN